MFDIHKIKMLNFKSYRGEHVFDMPDTPGLYFLTGKNKSEPTLGSNGSGKSTLLDAIYWCLYGKTLRGLKSVDIITWGESSCTVSVTLTVGNKHFTVRRAQSPNSVAIIEGKVKTIVEQDELQKRLRLNPDAFTYAVILPQFGQSFFELKPTDKLALFSQIMDLDSWLDKSKAAAEATQELIKQIDITKSKIENNNTWIASVKDDITEFKNKETDFKNELLKRRYS